MRADTGAQATQTCSGSTTTK